MLTKIEVVTPQDMELSLPFDSASSGILLIDADGLDPVAANIVSTNYGASPGAFYQAHRRSTRNIVLTLGVGPQYGTESVSARRKLLRRFFPTGGAVTLRLYEDDVFVAYVNGRVETHEAAIFTQDPEVSISIICFDPDFISPVEQEISGFSHPMDTTSTIEYNGDETAGFVLELAIDREISEFVIHNETLSGGLFAYNFAAPLVAGDLVVVSTVERDKYVTLIRDTVTTSALYGVSPSANWFGFESGTNLFRVQVDGDPIPYTLRYFERYGGF
jgi:hypothetical protein